MGKIKIETTCTSLGYSTENKCFMAYMHTCSFADKIFLIDASNIENVNYKIFERDNFFKVCGYIDMSKTNRIILDKYYRLVNLPYTAGGFTKEWADNFLHYHTNSYIKDGYFYDDNRQECFKLDSAKVEL